MNGFRLSAILLVMSAVVAIAPSAYANPCLNTAKKFTVLLELPNTKGSGVLISRVRDGNRYTYKVLTAYHVVEGIARNNKEGYVNLGDKQRYQLGSSRPIKQLENLGKKLDLAIVDFSSEREYEVAKVVDSRNLPESSNLYVAGFPLPSDAIPESTFRCKGGVLETILSVFNDGYQFVYDNSTLAGMSGGAVLNENAELVGIHGRTELANNGKGRNLGIPSVLFVGLLNLNESVTSNSSSSVLSSQPRNTSRNDYRFTMQGGARSSNWMNANVVSANSQVRFVGRAEIIFADGYKGSFYESAFAIWGSGGIVIDDSRLAIIPDNSSVCILQNNEAIEYLKTFAKLRQRNDQNNLERLRPKVEQLVPELLRSCRNSS